MRGFEQAISKPRYHLTQFHRPAMLKLVTVARSRGVRGPSAHPQWAFLPLWIFFIHSGKEEPVMFDHQEELDEYLEKIEELIKNKQYARLRGTGPAIARIAYF